MPQYQGVERKEKEERDSLQADIQQFNKLYYAACKNKGLTENMSFRWNLCKTDKTRRIHKVVKVRSS